MVISQMKALNLDTEDIGSETPKALRGWGMGNFFRRSSHGGLTPTNPVPTTTLSLFTAVIHVLVHDSCV